MVRLAQARLAPPAVASRGLSDLLGLAPERTDGCIALTRPPDGGASRSAQLTPQEQRPAVDLTEARSGHRREPYSAAAAADQRPGVAPLRRATDCSES